MIVSTQNRALSAGAGESVGAVLWEKDDLSLEETLGHFLRIRKERELGYDIEGDLIQGLGRIEPA